MLSCPRCSLSLADNAVFCPTCGWRAAAETTHGASAETTHGVSAGSHTAPGASPAEFLPTTSAATVDRDSYSEVRPIRKVLGYALMIAAACLLIEVKFVTFPHAFATGDALVSGHALATTEPRLVAGVCLVIAAIVSLVLSVWLHPPTVEWLADWLFEGPRRLRR
jgi:hypothetical protein